MSGLGAAWAGMCRGLRSLAHAFLPGLVDPPRPRTFAEALERCEAHLDALGFDVPLPQTEAEWEAAGQRMRGLGMTAEEFAKALGVLSEGQVAIDGDRPA